MNNHYAKISKRKVKKVRDYAQRCSLLAELMYKDSLAPLVIVSEYLALIFGIDNSWAKTPDTIPLAWIRELMADAEHEEILAAAEVSGVLERGLNDYMVLVLINGARLDAEAIRDIWCSKRLSAKLATGLRTFCEDLLRDAEGRERG